jgi:hypothetical protein
MNITPGASQHQQEIPIIPIDVIPIILAYCAYGHQTLVTASLINKEWHKIATAMYITVPDNIISVVPQYMRLNYRLEQAHVTFVSIQKLMSIERGRKRLQFKETNDTTSFFLLICACCILFIFIPLLLASILYYFGKQVPNAEEFSHYYLTNCTITDVRYRYQMRPTGHHWSCSQLAVDFICAINQSAYKNSTFQARCDSATNYMDMNKTYHWYIREGTYDIRFSAPNDVSITKGLGITAIAIAGIFVCSTPLWVCCAYHWCLRIHLMIRFKRLWKDIIKISDSYPGEYTV